MPGPPPKHPSVRRRSNRSKARFVLPSEGRKGKAPKWPLPGRQLPGEADVWRALWSTPQAVAWEHLGWVRTVARYCRVLVEAETPGAKPLVLAEARQLEDRLGLSPMAMLRLQWEVATDDVAEVRERRPPARPRLEAVPAPRSSPPGWSADDPRLALGGA